MSSQTIYPGECSLCTGEEFIFCCSLDSVSSSKAHRLDTWIDGFSGFSGVQGYYFLVMDVKFILNWREKTEQLMSPWCWCTRSFLIIDLITLLVSNQYVQIFFSWFVNFVFFSKNQLLVSVIIFSVFSFILLPLIFFISTNFQLHLFLFGQEDYYKGCKYSTSITLPG